jgi:hypothetical protein
MMNDTEKIIDEYRNADFEKRLYLSLSHRELRDEFLEIDQSDESVELSENPVNNDFRLCGNWCQSLINPLK